LLEIEGRSSKIKLNTNGRERRKISNLLREEGCIFIDVVCRAEIYGASDALGGGA
jgi:hypothetical protein